METVANLSIETLQILATEKILLFVVLGIAIFLILKNVRKSWVYVALMTFTYLAFTFILLFPLTRMWWGNNGDELYMGAAMTRVISGQFFSDFYYGWLPSFYPPLYFWMTGLISHGIAQNGIAAAKIGVLGSIVALFVGTYAWLTTSFRVKRGIPHTVENNASKEIVGDSHPPERTHSVRAGVISQETRLLGMTPIIIPLIFLLLLDFDAFIFKPHEALSALWAALFVGALAFVLPAARWSWKHYIFFGVSGAIIFLTYYFWWVLIAATFVFLFFTAHNKKTVFVRLSFISVITVLISLPYLIPLFQSILQFGIEGWQGKYFSVTDVETFVPFASFSLRSLVAIVGLTSLIALRRNTFFRAILALLIISYLYQAINLILFLCDVVPVLPSKPFLYLGTALYAIGVSGGITYAYDRWYTQWTDGQQKTAGLIALAFITILSPFIAFIDSPKIQQQIDYDLTAPNIVYLTDRIKEKVPDFKNRIWLTTGTPQFNLYLPLNYYIAHNAHYSHHASIFSKRLATVEQLLQSKDAREFSERTAATEPGITGLLLYKNPIAKKFLLTFYVDDFGNGGKEIQLTLDPKLIDPEVWDLRFSEGGWFIYIRKP